MGMLDRYKKKGGFTQLLNLIETSGGRKQEQFLSLIAQENPAWEQELKKKVLTVERIFSWPHDVMSEVLSRVQPLTLCVSLFGKPAEQIDLILRPLPPITKRKLVEQIAELKPTTAEKSSCEMKMISEVRAIALSGIIKFEKFDAELFIDENIEDKLGHWGSGIYNSDTTIEEGPGPAKPAEVRDVSKAPAPFGNLQELEIFKRKVAQMSQEINTLKHENSVLKDKLNQIRRIA